jgi:hypothetical protein
MNKSKEPPRRWIQRPEGSNWGDFGPDDQIGRLNLLTPKKVLQGIAEVREGKVFCLSLPLDLPGGSVISASRHPPVLRPTFNNGRINMNYRLANDHPSATEVMCDDVVILHTQYSTQWDSLAHAGYLFDADGDGVPEAVYYNGFRGGTDIVGPDNPGDAGARGIFEAKSTSRANALGIEHMAATGVQGRGVLINLAAHFGHERVLVGYDNLMSIMRADNIVVERGDMVCLHTGFAQTLIEMGGSPDGKALAHQGVVLDGRDHRLLDWITRSGLAALIADNVAIEQIPAQSDDDDDTAHALAPLHEHCLFKLGVPLGELWHLTPLAHHLAKRQSNRFLLTAPPLRLPGAVGSPTTPVATV